MTERLPFKVAIPARFGASRLPGKPLRMLVDRPLLQHVFECACESAAEEIVIATDDARVEAAARDFGATVCLTSSEHPSGTDRLAELADLRGWGDDEIVVNLQGDEPLMPPSLLDQVAADLATHPEAVMATLASPIHDAGELLDPHAVKVVMDRAGFALYFSRAPIPWERDAMQIETADAPDDAFRHIGLYAYRAGFLRRYRQLEACALERLERLEQLRVLWHGARIHVAIADERPGHGVDTEADLQRAAALLAKRSN